MAWRSLGLPFAAYAAVRLHRYRLRQLVPMGRSDRFLSRSVIPRPAPAYAARHG